MGFARESHRTYIGIRLSVFFLWHYHGNCVSLHSKNQRPCSSLYEESRLTPLFYQKTLKRVRCYARCHSKNQILLFILIMNLREDYIPLVNRIREIGTAGLPKDSHIILYGSRARGDANDDSDWDLLVLLDKEKIEQSDYDGICYDLTALGWRLGEMIIPVLYTKDEWKKNSFTPFYKNVVSEGIEIV